MFDHKNIEKPKTLNTKAANQPVSIIQSAPRGEAKPSSNSSTLKTSSTATTPQTTPLPTQPVNINPINTNLPRVTITTNSSNAYPAPKPTAPQAAPTSTKKSFRFANRAQQEKFFQNMDPNTLYAISHEELKRNIQSPLLVLNQIYTQFSNVDVKIEELIIKYKLEGLYNQVVSPQSVSKSISTSDKKLFPFANDDQVWLFFRDMQQTTIEEIAFNDYKQNISDGASLLTLIKTRESDFLGKVSELIIKYKLEGWYTQVTSPQLPKKRPFQIASNVKLFNNETQEWKFFQEIGQEKVVEIAWNELMKKISSGLILARTIHTQSSEFDDVVYNIIIKYNLIKSYQDMFPNSRVTFPSEPARVTTASVVNNNLSNNTAQQSTSTTVPENIKSMHVSIDMMPVTKNDPRIVLSDTQGSSAQGFFKPERKEEIPERFLCSSTKKMMTDPVTLNGGSKSYERTVVIEWLKGRPNDERSQHTFTSNEKLKREIENYKKTMAQVEMIKSSDEVEPNNNPDSPGLVEWFMNKFSF